MLDFESHEVRIPKAIFLMGAWGLVLLLASVIDQVFAPGVDLLLWLWLGATLLGLGAQLIAMVHGLGRNFAAWIAVILAGWAFTLYVFKFDNGAHVDLFGDLPACLADPAGGRLRGDRAARASTLLAAGRAASGRWPDPRAGGAWRPPLGALGGYATLIFGLVTGVSLLVAILPVWYRPDAPATQPDYAPAAAVEDPR